MSIHKEIFTGIFKFAGQLRDYNITKEEWILDGDTVLYSPAINEGYVRMLYPESTRHPRQKYLLTVKGLAAYKEIQG